MSDGEACIAAARIVAYYGLRSLLPDLLSAAKRSNSFDDRTELVRLLAMFEDQTVEAWLIGVLRSCSEAAAGGRSRVLVTLTLAVIEALRSTGSRPGAIALDDVTRSRAVPKEIRAAAETALSVIRSRLPHASTGQLAISEPRDGAGNLSIESRSGSVELPGSKKA